MISRRMLGIAEIVDRARAKQRCARIKGGSGMLRRRVSMAATMNAVDSEGREVLSPAAEGYWKDQERRYFNSMEGAVGNVAVGRNRWGRVSWRKIY